MLDSVDTCYPLMEYCQADIVAVIPAMDKLDSHLNLHTQQPYRPTIQAVVKLAHAKLNQYYSTMDLSSAYWIVMGEENCLFIHFIFEH